GVRQDFGYDAGRVGGFITPAAEPAYYGKRLPVCSFDRPLSASGTVTVGTGGNLDAGAGNTLVGFFNSKTVNEWRTPNSLAFRFNGRGEGFHAHVEYCTAKWRAGGDFFAAREQVN